MEVLPVLFEEGFSPFYYGPFLIFFIVISIKIVLALVASFPTNLVSLNSESVYRSCVSFGVLKKAAAVLPPMGAVLPRLLPWLVPHWTKISKTLKENQTRTKKDDARMQWFELSANDTIKLLIKSPP